MKVDLQDGNDQVELLLEVLVVKDRTPIEVQDGNDPVEMVQNGDAYF